MPRTHSLPIMIGLLTLLPAVPRAAPLDASACEQLRQEMSTIERSGARINLSKGAAWAKANLKPDQLQQIEKLIEAEAQFLFRCPQPKRQFDAATEAVMENGTGSDPDPEAAKSETPVTKTIPVKKAKPKPVTAAAAPETAAAGTAVPATAPAPPKRATPKPKPADAFQPPAPAAPAQ